VFRVVKLNKRFLSLYTRVIVVHIFTICVSTSCTVHVLDNMYDMTIVNINAAYSIALEVYRLVTSSEEPAYQ
jgi:hypothetical protein